MASTSHVFDSMSSPLTASPSQTARASAQMESDSHLSFHTWSTSHSLSSAHGDADSRDLNGKLIDPSSPRCRSSRLPTLPPSITSNLSTPPESAISFSIDNTFNPTTHQDVRDPVLNLAPYAIPSSSPTRSIPVSTPVENQLGFPSHDESLNSHSSRPRTSTQLFPLLPDLAAHYGIPQLLPPAPRTTPRKSSLPSSSSNHPSESFTQVCSNYLNMLSQNPDDSQFTTENSSPIMDSVDSFDPPADQAAQSVYDFLQASPLFSPDYPMSEYLTSPVDDSPQDDMLTTPHLGSDIITPHLENDMLTSPYLSDAGDSFDMNLFGGLPLYEPFLQKDPPSAVLPGNALDLDDLYSITSPVTPSLNISSVFPSPQTPASPAFVPSRTVVQRKSAATGTRKNVTPETLVPLDAPTQPRKYTTPSATSRKELPAVFAKKRARSQALTDDEEEAEAPLPPNASEREQIEWKRRQNTLAARKSRKRKLQHQIELENAVEQLTAEKEMWRVRALTYQALLKNHGHDVPEFS